MVQIVSSWTVSATEDAVGFLSILFGNYDPTIDDYKTITLVNIIINY